MKNRIQDILSVFAPLCFAKTSSHEFDTFLLEKVSLFELLLFNPGFASFNCFQATVTSFKSSGYPL